MTDSSNNIQVAREEEVGASVDEGNFDVSQEDQHALPQPSQIISGQTVATGSSGLNKYMFTGLILNIILFLGN